MRNLKGNHALARHILDAARHTKLTDDLYHFDLAIMLAQQERAVAVMRLSPHTKEPFDWLQFGDGDLEYYRALCDILQRFLAATALLAKPPSRASLLHTEMAKTRLLLRHAEAFVEFLGRPFARGDGLELLYGRKRLYARHTFEVVLLRAEDVEEEERKYVTRMLDLEQAYINAARDELFDFSI